MLQGALHHADIDSGILSGHARQHGLLRGLTRQPRVSPIQCGCTAGFGRSLTTGRGSRKADSVTQVLAAAPCQDTRGNTDHSAPSTGSFTSYPDQCGRTAGFG